MRHYTHLDAQRFRQTRGAYCRHSWMLRDLVGLWGFVEGSGGYVRDWSGKGNHGTWAGSGSHWDTGQRGSAGAFVTANSDYVRTDALGLFSGSFYDDPAFSVGAWIRPKDTIRNPIVASYSDIESSWWFREYQGYIDLGLYTNTTNRIVRRYDASVPQNQWSYAVVTYDGSRQVDGIEIYVNGVRGSVYDDSSSLGTYIGVSTDHDIAIGSLWPLLSAYKRFATMDIDDVTISRRVWSASDIARWYQLGPKAWAEPAKTVVGFAGVTAAGGPWPWHMDALSGGLQTLGV